MSTYKPDKTSASPYPPEQRAAAYFFHLLGDPKEFADRFTDWFNMMRDAMGDAQISDVDEMKRFLRWVMEVNEYSRKYLMVANDPMVTLRKNAAQLARRWRVENPVIDPDPLWETIRIPDYDTGAPTVQKRARRKPKSVSERKELLFKLVGPFQKINPSISCWLAQDNCEKCKGRGSYNVKSHPDKKYLRWQEHTVPCECIFKEEML